MGATTGIEWAHSTVNIWTGCAKVSPACKHCYAEVNSHVRAMQARVGLKLWGVDGFRYETANWEAELRRLNRKAAKARESAEDDVGRAFGEKHERPRVFVNSLSDTFEDWQGPVYRLDDGKPVVVSQSLDDVRTRFFAVAEECTELDILLLTKRPENVLRTVPAQWARPQCHPECFWPSHIWIGTTAEDQERADKRVPELLKVPAKVRFLSMEPLLGSVCLALDSVDPDLGWLPAREFLHWVIVGGESGTSARPMRPDWVRSIRDQCRAAGVPFFFKQWGEWWPQGRVGAEPVKIGKKSAGRMLDGRWWSEVPR